MVEARPARAPDDPRPGDVADDVDAAIRSRHSCRAFLARPVAPQTVHDLLEVARWTPSGSNVQPWKVHVVTGARRFEFDDPPLTRRATT